MYKEDRISKEDRKERVLYNFIFLLSIFFSMYNIPGTGSTSLSIIILLPTSVVSLLFFPRESNKNDSKVFVPLLFFAIYIIFDQLLVSVLESPDVVLVIKNLISQLIFILAIIVIPRYLDLDKLYMFYCFFAIVASIGLLVHAFQVFVLNMDVNPIFLPFTQAFHPENNLALESRRPCSFFSEPQAYATFMAPFIILVLFYKRNLFYALMATLTILLSTSTTGYFLVTLIWFYWLVQKKTGMLIKVLGLILMLFVFAAVLQAEFFEYGNNKLTNTYLLENERVGKPFYLFMEMDTKDKILGIGVSNIDNFVTRNKLLSTKNFRENSYSSSGFGNFINYGIIGGCLYLFLVIRMCFTPQRISRLIAIIILVTSFTQTLSFNIWGFLWFSSFIIIYNKEQDELVGQESLPGRQFANYDSRELS